MDFFSIAMGESNERAKGLLPLNTPENKRDVPCVDCVNSLECETQRLECVAARRWYASGDFEDKDINRLRRKMKSFG
jgi:hypothetical protein